MPFVAVPDTYEVVIEGHRDAIIIQNVFGWGSPDTLDQAKADTIGTIFAAAYGELLGATSDSFHWDTCTVTDIATETGAQFIATTFDDLVGTSSANPLPYQTAGLVSWKTNTRGRSYRGRTYLGLFTEAFSDGRTVASGLVDAMDDFATDLITPAEGISVISRYFVDPDTHVLTPRDPGFSTRVTDHVSHPLWRTQRRRATR